MPPRATNCKSAIRRFDSDGRLYLESQDGWEEQRGGAIAAPPRVRSYRREPPAANTRGRSPCQDRNGASGERCKTITAPATTCLVTTPSTNSAGPRSGGRDSTLATSSSPPHADLYEQMVGSFGAAIARLARAYERDDDRRQDLLQDIHLALWRSLASYDGRCAQRTWVYRVAHNVAASHVRRDRRRDARTLVSLDALEARTYAVEGEQVVHQRLQQGWLHAMLGQLTPLDRQLMLLYLEGLDAASIGEVSGLSSQNVATKIHRIKRILADRASEGVPHAE